MSDLVLVGAGPIGVAAARGALDEGVVARVAAVVDPDPEVRGAAAADFECDGLASTRELEQASEGDWAIAAYSSTADVVAPDILRLTARGYHVVTTCEELARPVRHIREALASGAVTEGRKVIATGANPGFVMDRLALAVASGCRSIRHIEVSRRVDTSTRRQPLVAKTGRGLDTVEFHRRASGGELGHVGLTASAKLLGRGLLWPTNDVSETIEPVIDGSGAVSGLHQRATLRSPEGGTIVLDLVMAWQVEAPGDTIWVQGTPELRVEIPGGYHGDLGTTAQVVNAIGRYTDVPPGFYRPIDLPVRFS